MKTCVVRRRFHTSESSGTAVTVDLETGFGVPKGCLIMYTESSAGTSAFDTTTPYRTLGIGMIGSTDSSVTDVLRYHSVFATMADDQSASDVRRQNSSTRFAQTQDTSGGVFWQGTSATFTTDQASFVFASTTPQTNGHLECIMTFFGGDDVNVGIGTHLMPVTAAGISTYTGLSFRPDIVFVASTITPINAGLTDDFRFSFSYNLRTVGYGRVAYLHAEGGAGTMDQATLIDSYAVAYTTATNVGPFFMNMVGITTGGFAITSSSAAAGSNNLMIFMAVSSGNPTRNDFSDQGITDTGHYNTSGGINGPYQFTGAKFVNYINISTGSTVYGVLNTTPRFADSMTLAAGSLSGVPRAIGCPGTITTNSANTSVTGSGTFFHRLTAGDSIMSNQTIIGTISNITSNTALTLTSNASSTLSNVDFGALRTNRHWMAFGCGDGAADSNVFSGVYSAAGSTFFTPLMQNSFISGGVPVLSCGTGNTPGLRDGSFNDDRLTFLMGFITSPNLGVINTRSFQLFMADNDNYNIGRRRKFAG